MYKIQVMLEEHEKILVYGCEWFSRFADDCTRSSWLYPLKSKSVISRVIQVFCNIVTIL